MKINCISNAQETDLFISSIKSDKTILRNMVFLYLYDFVWALGIPMINNMTTIPEFFNIIESPPLVFGIIQVCVSLPIIFQFLPKFKAFRIEKPKLLLFVVFVMTGIGFCLLGIASLFVESNPAFISVIMLFIYFATYCVYQLGIILYLDYFSNIFPGKLLGRIYGMKGYFLALGAILGTFLMKPLMNTMNFPFNYSILFITAGVLFAVSSSALLFTSDQNVTLKPGKIQKSIKEYKNYLADIIREPKIKLFVVLMMLINLCLSSYGFAMVFLNRQLDLNISPPTATMITYISQAILVIFVGYCLDRLGRIKTIVGYMTLVLVANLIILTNIKYGFVLIFAMYGMYNLFVNMVKLRFINEIAEQEHRMDVMAFVNVSGLLASSGLSLIYSLIAQVVKKYDFIFIATAVFVVCLYFVAYKLRKTIDSNELEAGQGKDVEHV